MNEQSKSSIPKDLFVHIIGLITVIPLAPVINRFIPPVLVGSWNIDLALAILISLIVLRLVLMVFRPLIIPAFLLVSGYVLYNHFSKVYSVQNIMLDYKNMVIKNWEGRDSKEKDLFVIQPDAFSAAVENLMKNLTSKVATDSVTRNFAVRQSLRYFDEYHSKYGATVRYLSLFKYINYNFKYVPDPKRDEYFATAKETIENGLGGDCDDHTILMVSAMKAIGARSRMVLTKDHVYPELYCGDKKSFMQMQEAIIQLFPSEKLIGLYFREENGHYWVNLDYTARHPGGPYVDNTAYAIAEF